MRVVDTDNFGRDYPDEKFVSESVSENTANNIASYLNKRAGPDATRFYRVVPDDYKLVPGFEP